MYVTDAVPIEVSAFVIPVDPTPESLNAARRGRGVAAVQEVYERAAVGVHAAV